MAITRKSKANAYARKYYRSNEDYRKKKIRERAKYYAGHKEEEAKNARDYYWDNPDYRAYKVKYARMYRLAHKRKKSK